MSIYQIVIHISDLLITFLNAHISPLIIYNSVADVPARTANIKNFTLFEQDLNNNALPQWMFITPNMSKFLCTF